MGTLYVVATPIGNLEDVTLRALRVLREVELVLAEDTRRTRTLLTHHDVRKRPRSLHAHNEAQRSREVLEMLASGSSVALVSDAGTPLVSDPGERLVAAVIEAGHAVVPIPGPSAVLSALVASGLPTAPFLFLGFLPRRAESGKRSWPGSGTAPRRSSSSSLPAVSPPPCAGWRTLSATGPPASPASSPSFTRRSRAALSRSSRSAFGEGTRGEVTLVIGGAPEEPGLDEAALDARIRSLVAEGSSLREIANHLAPAARIPKREIYARAQAIREEVVNQLGDPSPDPHSPPPAVRAGRRAGLAGCFALRVRPDPRLRLPAHTAASDAAGALPRAAWSRFLGRIGSHPPDQPRGEIPGRDRLGLRGRRATLGLSPPPVRLGPMPRAERAGPSRCDARLGRAPPARDRLGLRTDQPANLLLDQAADDPGSAPRRSEQPQLRSALLSRPSWRHWRRTSRSTSSPTTTSGTCSLSSWRVWRSRGRRRTDGSPTSRLSATSSKSRCSATEHTTSEVPCTTRCCSRICSIW